MTSWTVILRWFAMVFTRYGSLKGLRSSRVTGIYILCHVPLTSGRVIVWLAASPCIFRVSVALDPETFLRTRRIIFLFWLLWRLYVVRFAEQHQRVPRTFVEAEMLRRPIDYETSWIVEAFSYDVLIWSYLQLIGLWLKVYLQTFSAIARGGVLSWWSVSCLVRNLDEPRFYGYCQSV